MDLKKTRIDTDLAKDGVWVPLDAETRLKIAQWLNPNHRKYLQRLLDPHKRALRLDNMDQSLMEQMEADAIAKAVLVGWEGLKDNGKELKYSHAEAMRLLTDPELTWFLDFVREQAQSLSNFRDAEVEDEVEAVGKPSSGSSIGVVTAKSSSA